MKKIVPLIVSLAFLLTCCNSNEPSSSNPSSDDLTDATSVIDDTSDSEESSIESTSYSENEQSSSEETSSSSSESSIVRVTGVTLTETELTLNVGSYYYLNAIVTPENAIDRSVTWSTSNSGVATVKNGKVTAVSSGTSTIKAKTTDGGFEASCLVTVLEETTSSENGQTSEDDSGDSYTPVETETIYQITEAGTYAFDSSSNYEQIYVNAPEAEVIIEFSGVTISNSTNSPIYVHDCGSIDISAKKDTVNVINDNRPVYEEDDDTQGKGAIYVYNGDLKLKGAGALTINASYYNGIHGKDDIKIQKQTLNITAPNHGIRATDNIEITSGTINITCGGDGLKTTGSKLTDKGKQKGYVNVLGGDVTINSWSDGISASYNAVIANEDELVPTNLTINTNEYSTYNGEVIEPDETSVYVSVPSSVQAETNLDFTYAAYINEEWTELAYVKYKSSEFGGRSTRPGPGGGGWPGGGGSSSSSYHIYKFARPVSASSFTLYRFAGANNTNFSTTTYNAKSDVTSFNTSRDMLAISSISSSKISFGSWSTYSTSNSNKADISAKGIKAYNEIHIDGGTTSIKAYDDGLHTAPSSTLENGLAPTGIFYITGGNTSVYSTDDGIHARTYLYIEGGVTEVTNAYEGIEGGYIYIKGGMTYVNASDDGINAQETINVSAGYLDVTVSPSGDTDGIDSNGDYLQTGGIVIARGPNSTMMAALDSESTIKINAGTLIILGGTGVTVTRGSGVSTYSLSLHTSGSKTIKVDGTSCTFNNKYAYGKTTCYSSVTVTQ